MSRVYYCTECGTIKPPHYQTQDEKPCCPDNYAIPCDLTIAEQARIGLKLDLILSGVAPSRVEYLEAYAIVRDMPLAEIIGSLKEYVAAKFK